MTLSSKSPTFSKYNIKHLAFGGLELKKLELKPLAI